MADASACRIGHDSQRSWLPPGVKGSLRRASPALDPGRQPNHPQFDPLDFQERHLFATTSPRAHNDLPEGHPELKKHRLDFPAAPAGSKLFVRAVSPHEVELGAAPDISALDCSTVTKFVLES
jgi:hypothetical protein